MIKLKTIVTGGAGFIGSHLCEKLIKLGHKVIIIDNFSNGKKKNLNNISKNIEIIYADIRNYKHINRLFKNTYNVFHLAALADIIPSIEKPDNYFSTNVTGTYNVLKASVENKVKRFVYAASSSCYGIPKKYPTSENSKIDPKYPYALTKRLGEELVLHFSKVYKLNTTSLRLFNVYGPRSRTSGTYGAVFGVFLAQKIANKPFTIVGDGKQKRDFTYVSDVVDAMIKISKITSISGKVYNIGSGKAVSINKISKLLGGKKTFIPKRPGEPNMTFANINKIKKEINWIPKIDIEKGISLILEHLDEWKNAPIWTPKKIKHATKKWFYYLK